MASGAWPDVKYPAPPSVGETGYEERVVLVSGFRDWDDPTSVEYILEFVHPTILIHGAAAGVDWFADRWAKNTGAVMVEPHKIPERWWQTYGKRAGPMRNFEMVCRLQAWEQAGHKVLVVAFPQPGSRGTADLMEQAITANLPVLQYQ